MISSVLLDLAVVASLGIVVIRGAAHGSIREFFSLLGIFAGLLVAPLLVGPLSSLVRNLAEVNINVSRVIALAVSIGVLSLTGAVFGVLATRDLEPSGPRFLDKIGGTIFAGMRWLTLVSLFLFSLLAVTVGTDSSDTVAASVRDSASGQILSDTDSPFTIFYDGLLSRSDDLRALTLWVRQYSTFRESVPSDRLSFKATSTKLVDAEGAEEKMLGLINRERLERGVAALVWCGECAGVAQKHSRDMYRNGYFSHVDSNGDDPFDRMQEANIGYSAAGENLAIAPTPSEAHSGLMASADHRENILRPVFDEVGIGCYSGPYGLVCTQVFRMRLS
jgi:uncharacterized protein YkwD/uncharacterized membrane protein required for colicin V production